MLFLLSLMTTLEKQSKYRNHEDHKDAQEEQRQWLECIKNWLECIKNSYAIAKDWMDKDKALWVESKLGLDSNSELESISLINMTHPSLEEALEKITQRVQSKENIAHS